MKTLLFLMFLGAIQLVEAWYKKQKQQKKELEAQKHLESLGESVDNTHSGDSSPVPSVDFQELIQQYERSQQSRDIETPSASFEHFETAPTETIDVLDYEDDDYETDDLENESYASDEFEIPDASSTENELEIVAMNLKKDLRSNELGLSKTVSVETQYQNKISDEDFRNIAYFIISQTHISESSLIQEFHLSRSQAIPLLQRLESLKIIRREFDDFYQVLIHDLQSLERTLTSKSVQIKSKLLTQKLVFNKKEAQKGVLWHIILEKPRFKTRYPSKF